MKPHSAKKAFRLWRKTFPGVRAMRQAQADVPPTIIHTLRVLLDRTAFPPEHVKWVEDGARAILANWDRAENLEQLRHELGLKLPKKPRTAVTIRRETAIAAAIANAAVAGTGNPKKAAGSELDADEREVQRAWKTWGPVYLAQLQLMQCRMPRNERVKIGRAIARLNSRHLRLPDKK